MPADFAFEVAVEWVEEDPEPGTLCAICGDQPWLRAWRLWLRLNGRLHTPHPQLVVCDACKP